METVKLSDTGQIAFPKSVREAHHLAAGTEFIVSFVGDEIRLRAVPKFPRTRVEDVAGALARRDGKGLSDDETEQAIGLTLRESDEATKR